MGLKASSTKTHVFKSRLSVAVVPLCLNYKGQVCLGQYNDSINNRINVVHNSDSAA